MRLLTALSLQDNCIAEIGKELMALPALKELRLDNNNIAKVENIPKSLAYLNLSGNRLTKLEVLRRARRRVCMQPLRSVNVMRGVASHASTTVSPYRIRTPTRG